MSAGHGHGHGHGRPVAAGHAGARHQRRLALAFAVVAAFFVVELTAALASGSLALLSDAGHMGADVVALGAALLATRIASRSDPAGRRTYGSYRAEVFASGLAVLLMLGVSAYVVLEAVDRIGEPAEVGSLPLLVVGALGLLANLAALILLRRGAGESLNVRGAYLEVLADTVGSVGVLVAGLLVALTGRPVWDTVVALAIGVFVAVRAAVLGREVLVVLAQHAPAGVDVEEVTAGLGRIRGVEDVHDLHLWTLTSGMHVATAHLVATPDVRVREVLEEAQTLLRERHGIAHATLQVEPVAGSGCTELDW